MKKFDTSMLRMMIASASINLKNNRKMIDDLNIFPVPDGDTGTNMSLTFSGATKQTLAEDFTKCDKLMAKLASSALRNARGNSGVILSQIIRGFAKGVEGKSQIDVITLCDAFSSARKSAYRAVMKPTEGTILTVIRQMAEFAEEHVSGYTEVDEFLHAILEAGHESLKATTNMLPALKKAGVVDAGGKGLITIIEGAVYAVDNGAPMEGGETVLSSEPAAAKKSAAAEPVDIKYLYCTEFIINKTNTRSVAQFRTAISEKGDCMLVIEDDDIVKVHIHTNHPGFVLEQAVRLGELTDLKIENMKYQHNDKVAESESEDSADETMTEESAPVKAEPQKKYGFAVVSAGEGLSEIFRSLNADEIIEGGQTMNPSTQDLLTAVDKVPAEIVFILPNNKNIILAADQVAPLTEKKVVVIPTVNIPQGISAMAAFDESVEVDDNIAIMKEMMDYVSCGQVTFAARDTELDGMEIHFGDCLAVCGKEITAVTKTPEEAAVNVVETLVNDESGVITLYYGEETKKEDAQRLTEKLAETYGDLDISLCYGGQPVYYYIISVE